MANTPEPRVVFSAPAVQIGEMFVYPAKLGQNERHVKGDVLRATRIENGFIYGVREFPEGEWDEGYEFAVYPSQIAERGVIVGRAVVGAAGE